MKKLTIESAKQFLKDNGYFIDNLWCVDDVKLKYDCTDEQAQYVLNSSLTNDATMEQIQFSIQEFATIENLPLKNSKYYLVSGFWKDDKVKFCDYIVKECDVVDENEDTDIFYYGLNEDDLNQLIINGWNNEHEFVITSYKEKL